MLKKMLQSDKYSTKDENPEKTYPYIQIFKLFQIQEILPL